MSGRTLFQQRKTRKNLISYLPTIYLVLLCYLRHGYVFIWPYLHTYQLSSRGRDRGLSQHLTANFATLFSLLSVSIQRETDRRICHGLHLSANWSAATHKKRDLAKRYPNRYSLPPFKISYHQDRQMLPLYPYLPAKFSMFWLGLRGVVVGTQLGHKVCGVLCSVDRQLFGDHQQRLGKLRYRQLFTTRLQQQHTLLAHVHTCMQVIKPVMSHIVTQ